MYKSLDLKGITVMRLNAIFLSLIILIIVGVGAYIVYPVLETLFDYILFYGITGLILILCLLNVFLFPRLRYNRYQYLIDKNHIEVKKGLLFITTSHILIKRVQKVELSNGPIDRIFGLSNVNIYTAAGNIDIKFLKTDEALEISKQINTLLNQSLGKKKKNEN